MQLTQIKPNLNKVTIGEFHFWFSYETLVACADANGIYCSENQWSTITAKHLNEIQPDKSKRIAAEAFNVLVKGWTQKFS